MSSGGDGTLSVLRDVAVQSAGSSEVLVISPEAGVVGDVLVVDIPDDRVAVEMQVVESRPVVVDGAVRHRVRLQATGSRL